jgi:hypothetical protein
MSDGSETDREGAQASGSPRAPSIFFFWPLWVMPVLVLGGLVAATKAPGPIESFYIDMALPFLITFWIGLGFTLTWRYISEPMRQQNVPPGIVAAVGVLSALILLSMLGGIRLFWEDPWLFGVAVAPGFAMARPLVERWLAGGQRASETDRRSSADGLS